MTRSQSERLDKLESDQADLKGKLEDNSLQLAEIRATLAEFSKVLLKPSSSSASGPQPEGDATSDSRGPIPLRAPLSPVQLPSFDGSDPIGWLARANQQFELHNVVPGSKVSAAVVAMEDSALYWVTWLRSRKPGLTWEEFSQALVARFDTRFKGNSFERLADIKQSDSVDDYVNLFVQLASQVPGLSDAHYLGYFMKGLKDSIRSSLRLLRPGDLETAMELSRDIEDNLEVQAGGRPYRNFSFPTPRLSTFPRPNSTNSGAGGGGSQGGSSSNFSRPSDRPPPARSAASGQSTARSRFTRVTPQHILDLRAKGLCFRCQKPYTPDHVCPLKQLRVMVAEEDEALDLQLHDYYEPTGEEEMAEEQREVAAEDGTLSFYSMAGIMSPRTMLLRGVVKGRTVTVLIDSGASHNLISASLVTTLRLQPDRTRKFGVQLGDGRRQESEGVCRDLAVSLPGCEVTADYYIFSLGGVDVILGIAWLATLGEVRTNWESLTMSFDKGGSTVVLRGDSSLGRSPVSLRTLTRVREAQLWAVVVEKEAVQVSASSMSQVGNILQQFDKAFLKVRPHRQTSMARQSYHKLAAKFYGPFVVEGRVGPSAYRLTLPPTSRIHPVFHVSQLRPVVGDHPMETELPATLELPLGALFEPESILASRKINVGAQDEEQVLVKWFGQSVDEATWLEVEHFKRQFPDFNLEDKVDSKGKEVDREQRQGAGVELLRDGDAQLEEEGKARRPLLVYRRRGRE